MSPAPAMLALLLAAAPAAAQDRPAVHPEHDVAVTYRIAATGPHGTPETRTIRMAWTGHGTRMRLETPGQPGFALIDFTTNRMTLVIAARHAYVELPFDPAHAPGLDIPPDVTLTRAGADTVAATPCTLWTMHAQHGGGQACITADGLVLRVRGDATGQPAALEAITVAYAPQPPALFTLPPGLTRLSPGAR